MTENTTVSAAQGLGNQGPSLQLGIMCGNLSAIFLSDVPIPGGTSLPIAHLSLGDVCPYISQHSSLRQADLTKHTRTCTE